MVGCILQVIGRLNYEDLEFMINGDRIRAKLVSEALRRSIGRDMEVVLLVPESLVILVVDNVEEAAEFVKDTRSLEEVFYEKIRESGLIDGDFKVKVIKSAGVYSDEGSRFKIHFENSFDNIVTYLFLDLISLENSEIVVDISTGQNFYIAALLEAIRHLIVYRKLENIFHRERGPRILMSTIPPFTQGIGKKTSPPLLPVNFSEIDVKVFFEYPLRIASTGCVRTSISLGDYISKEMEDNKRNSIIQELLREFKREFDEVVKLLNLCRLSFNALKYNAPLCFYDERIINFREYDIGKVLNILKKLLEYVELKKEVSLIEEEKTLRVSRIPISRPHVVNTFLTIALYKSIKEELGELGIKGEVVLEEIVERFREVYEKLGLMLNITFLQREISNIKRVTEFLREGEEKCYRELLKEVLREEPGRPQDPKRNFFAHAGLTYDTVLVRREGGRVKVRYKGEEYENIRNYLSGQI